MAARKYGQEVDKPKPRNDAYTGLLGVSFVAMLIGCLLLFLDYNNYESGKPPKVNPPPLPKGAAMIPPAAAPGVVVPKAKEPDVKKEEPAKKDEMKKDEPKKDEKKDAKKDEKKDEKKKDEKKKDE